MLSFCLLLLWGFPDAVISDAPVVAFYNMYVGPDEKTGISYYHQILNEQMEVIKGSGLYDRLDNIYYATIGEHGENYTIPDEKFEKLRHHGHHADETETLALLYSYCSSNPHQKVLYFHNKGSFHYNDQNTQFRRALNCYNLNSNCIEALDEYDTCGMRASLIPQIHYSGNFWWAKCSYINTLVDPLSMIKNETFKYLTEKEVDSCIGYQGRYFAENWVGSHPNINPSDCMSPEDDKGFTFGYFFFPSAAIDKQCQANHYTREEEAASHPDGKGRGRCSAGSMFKYTEEFRDAADHIYALTPNDCKIDMKPQVERRSLIWYGQPPQSYINAIDRLYIMPNITALEGKSVKINRMRDCFYIKNGKRRAIPGINEFMALGFDDFDQVLVLRENEFNFIPPGPPLPYLPWPGGVTPD